MVYLGARLSLFIDPLESLCLQVLPAACLGARSDRVLPWEALEELQLLAAALGGQVANSSTQVTFAKQLAFC